MAIVMMLVEAANGERTKHAGKYLLDFDPDRYGGRGRVVSTSNKERALQFENAFEAAEVWKRQSTMVPLRDDGEPNRPLTAFTVTFEPM